MPTSRWVPAASLIVLLQLAACGSSAPGSAGSLAAPSGSGGTSGSPGATVAPTAVPSTTRPPAAPTTSRASTVGSGRAPTTSFAVGSRQLNLSRGNRPLRTLVWYPASGPAGGSPKPDAPAAAGRFPLVLFSHGLMATPEDFASITTVWAAAGFVVAAPAYPFTNGDAGSAFNANDMANQPADATAVITAVLSLDTTGGDLLAGHIDASRVAAGGHSAGGYTTVGELSGSTRDTRLKAGMVLSGGSLGAALSGPAAQLLFVHGDMDTTVPIATGRAVYNSTAWPKAFMTIVGGDHLSPVYNAGSASQASHTTMLDFLRWSLYGDAAAKGRLAGDATIAGRTSFESSL
jgi:dienelactone hydrolase